VLLETVVATHEAHKLAGNIKVFFLCDLIVQILLNLSLKLEFGEHRYVEAAGVIEKPYLLVLDLNFSEQGRLR